MRALLVTLVLAGLLVLAGATARGAGAMPADSGSVHVYKAFDMCACGGGYPPPPFCWSGIAGAGWYGHFWAAYFYNPNILLYRQTTFVCGYNRLEWQVFINDGIDPDAAGGMTWGAIAYS